MKKLKSIICKVLGGFLILMSLGGINVIFTNGINIYNLVLLVICVVGAFIMFKVGKQKKEAYSLVDSKSEELGTSNKKDGNINANSINLLHKCLVRDLITIAVADGSISPISEQNIKDILKSKSLDINLYDEILNTQPDKIRDSYPTSQDDKENYLFCLTYIMLKDKPSKRKKDYLLFVARKMQLSEEDVISTIDSVSSSPF